MSRSILSISCQLLFVTICTSAQQFSNGQGFALLLCPNESVWAAGTNSEGQCGRPDFVAQNPNFHHISVLSNVVQVATGKRHCLALMADGTVWTCGENIYDELGYPTNEERNYIPKQVPGLPVIEKIAGGFNFSLAIDVTGDLWAWGDNFYDQIGIGSSDKIIAPTQVTGIGNVKAVTGGSGFTAAVTNDGKLYTWGRNFNGQLGDGTTNNANTPQLISSIEDVSHISVGNSFILAVKSDKTLWGWGDNGEGQLGLGDQNDRHTPVEINVSNVANAKAGANFSVAVRSDSTVWAWGWNDNGQLGLGNNTAQNTPQKVASIDKVVQLETGGFHVLSQNVSKESRSILDITYPCWTHTQLLLSCNQHISLTSKGRPLPLKKVACLRQVTNIPPASGRNPTPPPTTPTAQ